MIQYVMALDIGNTNTVVGLFDKNNPGDILYSWRTVTQRNRTSDEMGIFLYGFLQSSSISMNSVKGFIYSSVVPSFNPIIERMSRDYLKCEPFRVTSRTKLPITIDYPRPDEIGADRLVNACASAGLYPGDSIIVDMGTATTFCILHDKTYLGGVIAPGLKLSMEALSRNTAQLPPIEFSHPKSVTGKSTVEALQAGFFYGWVGLLREITHTIMKENPGHSYKTIATGGLSALIHQEMPGLFDTVDSDLTMKGLREIYVYQ